MKKSKTYKLRISTLFVVFILLFTTIPFFSFTVSAGSPTVTTNAATGVTATNATLQGTLTDNGGENCTVGFEYGLTTSYGIKVVPYSLQSTFIYAGGVGGKLSKYWQSNMTRKQNATTS